MKEQTTDEFISESIVRTKLLNARKTAGLTQSELAVKSGLSVSCISNMESMDSQQSPKLDSVVKYLEALGYRLTVIKQGDKLRTEGE